MSAPFLSHKSRNSCSRTYTSPRLCKLSDQKEPDHSLQWSQGFIFIIATSQHHTQTHYYLKPFSKTMTIDGGLVGFTDTQPCMLPGMSWKRNVRSKF